MAGRGIQKHHMQTHSAPVQPAALSDKQSNMKHLLAFQKRMLLQFHNFPSYVNCIEDLFQNKKSFTDENELQGPQPIWQTEVPIGYQN